MRLIKKNQFFCSSAERTGGHPGDFYINLSELDQAEDLFYKIYLQQFVIRYDKPYITGNNNLVRVAVGVGGGVGTYSELRIPEGGPSIIDLVNYINGAVSATGDLANMASIFFKCTYLPGTGRVSFTAADSFSIDFAAPNSAHVPLGFNATVVEGIAAPGVSAIANSVRPGVLSFVSTIDVTASFGANSRFVTQAGGAPLVTEICASAPILGPYLSNVAYADIVGANGLIAHSARQDFSRLHITVKDNTRQPFTPLEDWPFVVAVETWRDDFSDAFETLSKILTVLQIDAIGQTFTERRELLENADLDIALPEDFQRKPETNAPPEMQPLQNDPSKYPQPPPDLGGLVPFEYQNELSLNNPETIRRQIKRARGA